MDSHRKDWNRELMKDGFIEGGLFKIKHSYNVDNLQFRTGLKIMEPQNFLNQKPVLVKFLLHN